MNHIVENGFEYWTDDYDRYHREDGPAIISKYGVAWYCHGQRHRIGAPAIIMRKFEFQWFQYNKLHRLDGPAIEYFDKEEWWIDGIQIDCKDNEEFLRIVKLKELL
jgi:hypothetical protein